MKGFLMKIGAICLVVSVVSLLAATPAVAKPGEVFPPENVEMPLILLGTESSEVILEPGELVAFPEEPAATKKLIEELPYLKTKAPEKLTLEQLETIAKLPPRSNKAGIVVHPAMVPLFKNMALHYTGGGYKNSLIHFRLHTPDSYQPGKTYPMIVWLHGAGECGSDNINQIGHLHHMIPYLVGPKKRDFFLLVPQCPHTHCSWEAPQICATKVRADGSVECHTTKDPIALGNAPIGYTLAMIDAIVKKYPIDTNRITVAGLSTGGEGTWKILERSPNLFAAAVPMVSWDAMSAKSLREHPILKKIPIWAIYSSDDRGIDFARKEFKRMQDTGCHVFKTEFGVCGHRAWTPAMLQGDVFGWLLSRAKDGDRFYAAEPSPTDPEKIGTFANVTGADNDLMQRRLRKQPTLAPKKTEKPKKTITPKERSDMEREIYKHTHMIKLLQKRMGLQGKRQKFFDEFEKLVDEAIQHPSDHVATPPETDSLPWMMPVDQKTVEKLRLELVVRYIRANKTQKAFDIADKIRNRHEVLELLLRLFDENKSRTELLDYIGEALDRMEPVATPYPDAEDDTKLIITPQVNVQPFYIEKPPLEPIPAGKKNPKDECGKEWAMSSTTLYGMFPNGWEKESKNIPDYVLNETGKQLFLRLTRAYNKNDLKTMKEICNSFIKLDDVPLSSPWFNTSGRRLQGRIKYSLNKKSKLVVEVLRQIALIPDESKKEFAQLAKKALDRIEKITHPKTEDGQE